MGRHFSLKTDQRSVAYMFDRKQRGHFSLKTDQRSVAYMFDRKQGGKIKNDKIMRWRMELSGYNFDIVYRPGKENIPPDTLSRENCNAMNSGSLAELPV